MRIFVEQRLTVFLFLAFLGLWTLVLVCVVMPCVGRGPAAGRLPPSPLVQAVVPGVGKQCSKTSRRRVVQ
jgi:hypothetical protein